MSSRTRTGAIGRVVLADITIDALPTNQTLPKGTNSSVSPQKTQVRAQRLQYPSTDWLSLVLTISMPNSMGSWGFHEEECEQSGDAADVLSMYGLTQRNVSNRSTCSKNQCCIPLPVEKQQTEHKTWEIEFPRINAIYSDLPAPCPQSNKCIWCTSHS